MTLLSQKLGAKAGGRRRRLLHDEPSCAIDESWQALRFVYRLKDR